MSQPVIHAGEDCAPASALIVDSGDGIRIPILALEPDPVHVAAPDHGHWVRGDPAVPCVVPLLILSTARVAAKSVWPAATRGRGGYGFFPAYKFTAGVVRRSVCLCNMLALVNCLRDARVQAWSVAVTGRSDSPQEHKTDV